MKHSRPIAALFGVALIAAACQPAGSSPSSAAASSAAASASEAAEVPDELVIGFVPSSEAGQLVEDIQPLADYLTDALGIPVTGTVTNDYTGLVTAMQTGQAHIGALPPYGLLQAIDQADAEVILQSERFGSGTYHTQFFTNDPDTFCSDEPVENTRVNPDGEEVTFLNCNGTDRANDETPEGPIGLDALDALEPGSTVIDVADSVHNELAETFVGARIWGPSARFEGQKVGRDQLVRDGDDVEILKPM